MKLATFLTTVIVLLSLTLAFTGANAKPDTTNDDCEWHYECCEYEPDPEGGCKTLCPTPKIVCPVQSVPGRDSATEISPKAGKTRVIVTVPCKEGFMQDHQKMCRQVFSNL
uniref:Putative conserved secreted protein n=1 Tax=Anopheles darlingi TaxID=43151 RepID=A0A2M4DBQ6_ANODA